MEEDAKLLIIGGLSFATGLLVGIGAGLLIAPQSGARTRRQITNLVEDLKEDATHAAEDAREVMEGAIGGVVERGKRMVK